MHPFPKMNVTKSDISAALLINDGIRDRGVVRGSSQGAISHWKAPSQAGDDGRLVAPTTWAFLMMIF